MTTTPAAGTADTADADTPASQPRPAGDPMIRLENLTKRYPGQSEPAVEDVSMDIPAGEIVVFVGPSGSGKTTTLKMINRIIQPTSGRIFLDGDDVTDVDADQLRRRIGYVIQQVGLFPHMTVARNVAMVPQLLGWDKARITDRVDELLTMVNLDPAQYRDRYPKELSGGQRQRVGVARGLAADPPVMLMDEPFGAIDPITRERLQNEFLRLQEEMRKTICFVTHDIDEAIKLGDRIAILGDRSIIQQYDTPEAILTDPANDFVEDFIGSGSALKRLNLTRVREVQLDEWAVAESTDQLSDLRRRLADSSHGSILLLDDDRRPERWLDARDLSRAPRTVEAVGLPVRAMVEPQATLRDALDEMITSKVGCAVVVDGTRRYVGVVDMDTITRAMEQMRASVRTQAREAAQAARPATPTAGTPAVDDEADTADEAADEAAQDTQDTAGEEGTA